MNTRHESDPQLDDMLTRVRDRVWPGPDHNPKVDAFLQERIMRKESKPLLNRTTIALIVAGLLGGGAVTAAVTHQIMSQRAVLVTEDGTKYEVMLSPTTEGASGTFVTDEGTVYGIDMAGSDTAGERTLTVDMDSATPGSATVSVTDDEFSTTGAKFIDEDGVEYEVDPAAVDGWITDDEG
ncbi:MAG: hypothetical protein DHS20C14_13430 [Phycisphaeraceae bacterium]|nr:MAG: hypothetical protein DHS20C14_13430 [Phycisphaeraceae bacterium]